MEPTRHVPPSLQISAVSVFPQDLYDELVLAVKGPVFRPTDEGYRERAQTFNGQLKPQCQVLVSPLDAHDVSAIIKFCLKHAISPSVRSGGYGIAGWAVAGDLVIDMSMIKDIEIEPPQAAAEGGPDWTLMKNMLPPGSKGKGRAEMGRTQASPAPAPEVPGRPDLTRTETTTGKRRREDRTPSPGADGADEMGSSTGRGQFDGASHTVAKFLNGPPLPPVPGEMPRQPPTNRPRLHSPEPEPAVEPIQSRSPGESVNLPGISVPQAHPPALGENARQISGGSTGSSDSTSIFSTITTSTSTTSANTTATSASATSPDQSPPSGSGTSDVREPFGYLSSSGSGTANYGSPAGFGSGAWSGVGLGVSAVSSFFPPPPDPSSGGGGSTGVTAWNPILGLGMLPLGSTGPSFSMPPSFPYPPSMSSMMPTSTGQHFHSAPGALGGSDAFAQALLAAQATSGHLGTMPHAKPVHPHAYVTFGAGMRQKEIDLYTADHPLEGVNPVSGEQDAAVPYHVPMSAHPVGSSIMLLAGFGFISRLYGLSIDNIVEVEMVLADGRIIIVNAEEDPELWWAIRGAGPAFGIATRYKARAYPVPVVFAGNLIYRFHRATAASLIKHFRDCIKNAPRELYANVLLTAGPADQDSLVVIQMCYVGPKEKGMEYLQAISSWDGERCLLNEVNEKSFLNQQDSIAQVLRGRAGRQWFLRSALITTLPDELINRTVNEFASTPIGCTWIFELAGGAIGDFEDTALPKEQREAIWTVAALHQWDIGVDDPRCVTAAEDWMKGTIKTSSVGGPYPTFLGRHELPNRVMACYGKNWDRLAALKRKYDPDCFFKNNFWPLDKEGKPIAELTNEPPSP